MSRALGKASTTLDKLFAECDTQQKGLNNELYINNCFFAEYCRVTPRTRQRKVVVTASSDGDRAVTECTHWYSAKLAPVGPHASLCLETHKLSLGIVNVRRLQTAADDALSSVNVCRESFTECVYAEHSALGKITHRQTFSFAESSTWQSKFCRVHDKFPSAKN